MENFFILRIFFYTLDANGNPVTQSIVGVTDSSGNPVTGKRKLVIINDLNRICLSIKQSTNGVIDHCCIEI